MGALGALGFLAPIGETLGGIGNAYKQQQTQQDAQTKLLQDLVGSNPEYQPLLDYNLAGGKDVLPLLGGNVGQSMMAAFRRQQFQTAIQQNQAANGSPTDLVNRLAAAGAFADGDEYLKAMNTVMSAPPSQGDIQQELQDFYHNLPANFPDDQKARLAEVAFNPNPNKAELYDMSKMVEGYGKPKGPLRVETKPVPDPNTGWDVLWRHTYDPTTGEEVGQPKADGIQMTGAMRDAYSQAVQLLHQIPDAQHAAEAMDQRLEDLGQHSTQDKRRWLVDQMRAYNADRKAYEDNPFNPMAQYYLAMHDVDPVFKQYATLMGQTQAQMAQPMHIFRSMQLFQAIAPHIMDPADLPKLNLERLAFAQNRWGQDVERLTNLERGLGMPQVQGGAYQPFAPYTGPDLPSEAGGGSAAARPGADATVDDFTSRMWSKYGKPGG